MSLIDGLYLDPAPFHVWITDRKDGQRGSGLVSDPYNGKDGKFDGIMNTLPSGNVVVHIGPGTFITNGYVDPLAGESRDEDYWISK